AEQADCGRARLERGHGEGAPRPAHAQDGSQIGRRPGADGRPARRTAPGLAIPRYRVATPGCNGPAPAFALGWLMTEEPLVAIVDDDESHRRATRSLLRAAGFATAAFSDAESFLASATRASTACLVADMKMRGMS